MADHVPETPQDSPAPQLRDLRPRIRALLPQNMQARVLAGIALLMTLVILFSGRKSGHETKPTTPVTRTQASDPNLARIEEYRVGIEAATRQLAAEEAQLSRAKEALVQPATSGPSVQETSQAWQASQASFGRTAALPRRGAYSFPEPAPPVSPSESQKRAEQSLFASNVVLSYRSAPKATEPAYLTPEPSPKEEAPKSGGVSREERGMSRLFEGTIIETVLTNRLDSSFSGPVNCMVTANVYSPDRTALLIPQGSRVLGEVRKVESLGEQRLAVFFHRILRPDGYSVSLDKFQGLSQIGETGLLDQVNHHYVQIFGAAIAIGGIAGLAQANTRYGADETAADAYQQGVATSLSQSSMHVLDRYLNVLPTFTIREGHRVKVYLSQDLSLPAYDPRTNVLKE